MDEIFFIFKIFVVFYFDLYSHFNWKKQICKENRIENQIKFYLLMEIVKKSCKICMRFYISCWCVLLFCIIIEFFYSYRPFFNMWSFRIKYFVRVIQFLFPFCHIRFERLNFIASSAFCNGISLNK